jgi:hypothetical protein
MKIQNINSKKGSTSISDVQNVKIQSNRSCHIFTDVFEEFDEYLVISVPEMIISRQVCIVSPTCIFFKVSVKGNSTL